MAEPVLAEIGEPTVTWTEGPTIEGHARTAAWMGDRWVVAGSLGGRAAVWTSTDGSAWSPAPPIDPAPVEFDLAGDPTPSSHWISALAEWEGRLVAAGVRRFGFGDGVSMAMWTSADGQSWQHSDLAEVDIGGTIPTIAMAPDERLIIIGQGSLGSQTFIYVTTDGETWEASPLAPREEFQAIRDVAGGPPTLFGVGFSGTVEVGENQQSGQSAIWASPDWVTWEPLLTGPPGRLVALAYELEAGRFIAGGAHYVPYINLLGSPVGSPAVWLSDASGRSWSPVIVDSGSGHVQDVEAVNGTIIGLGTRAEPFEYVVWESRDGSTWAATSLLQESGETPMLVAHEGQVMLLIPSCCDVEQTRTWIATVEP